LGAVNPVFGTIVNALAIIAGSLIGLTFMGGIGEKYSRTMMQAMGLVVILIGIRSALKTDAILVVIISLAVGSMLGEWMGIEKRLGQFGMWLEQRFSGTGSGIAKGFVTASLLFCVGAMAIVGALESGLAGNHQTLFAKAIIDGISSIVFASTLGLGVLFSAVSVFVYQGFIVVSASYVQPFLLTEVVDQMSAVGGLLILGIGIGLLEIKNINIGNMLPAIFMPLAYMVIKHLIVAF
jgi:uncharacterized membrane protein YqgA involved in biofilm formation